MKKYKKVLMWVGIILVVVIAACALEYALYYRSHPMIKEKHIQTKGYLMFAPYFETCEVVDVEIKGEELTYLFKNHEEAVQGWIFVNGQSIFSKNIDEERPEFYMNFHEQNPNMSLLHIGNIDSMCKELCISKDWNTIVCGLMADSSISNKIDNPMPALLVINATTKEEAQMQLEKAATHPAMKRWLDENEINNYAKERFIQASAEHQKIDYQQALEQHESKYQNRAVGYATYDAEAIAFETSDGLKGANFVVEVAYICHGETGEVEVFECYVSRAYMPDARNSQFKCGGYNIVIEGSDIRISATGQFEFDIEKELEVAGDIISNEDFYLTKVKTGVLKFSGNVFK